MSDSEHQPAAVTERPDEPQTPTEAAAPAAALNGASDDADVPQLESADDDGDKGDNGGVLEELDEPKLDENLAASLQTPTKDKPRSHALPIEGSELGSVDADEVDLTPRRTGSPADSLASGQGISPSIQVRRQTIRTVLHNSTD